MVEGAVEATGGEVIGVDVICKWRDECEREGKDGVFVWPVWPQGQMLTLEYIKGGLGFWGVGPEIGE